jgi:cyclohexanone monooxygenase
MGSSCKNHREESNSHVKFANWPTTTLHRKYRSLIATKIESDPFGVEEALADHYDVIVTGAGFAGLRMLRELRELGMSCRVLEEGADIGGTWYWNRYPGCRTDSEAWYYSYSFSEDLINKWSWSERFPAQPEVERYLQFVADSLGLKDDIEFETQVRSAVWNEELNNWTITTADEKRFTCTFYITAQGLLSAPHHPTFAGLETFEGEHYWTSRWPADREPDFTGQRVAIIGSGATGVQALPVVAQTAQHVTLFQRTATYVLPSRNHALDRAQTIALRRDHAEMWKRTENHPMGMPYPHTANRVANDVSAEEQQRILEAAWESGTFRFLFETFDDLNTDETTNKIVTDFICRKIRAIVKDGATAELLCPNDHALGSKRPPLGQFYYEAFNRDNVSLVSVQKHPIDEIVPSGIRVGEKTYDFDVIIFATGFDAVTGALTRYEIKGKDGLPLTTKWAHEPTTYLSVAVDEFPNMFMILGPSTPFAVLTVVIEHTVQFISRVLSIARDMGNDRIEATPDAVSQWNEEVQEAVRPSLPIRGTNSWLFGANIPGKPRAVLQYFGGLDEFIRRCRQEVDAGLVGFDLSSSAIKKTTR